MGGDPERVERATRTVRDDEFQVEIEVLLPVLHTSLRPAARFFGAFALPTLIDFSFVLQSVGQNELDVWMRRAVQDLGTETTRPAGLCLPCATAQFHVLVREFARM